MWGWGGVQWVAGGVVGGVGYWLEWWGGLRDVLCGRNCVGARRWADRWVRVHGVAVRVVDGVGDW